MKALLGSDSAILIVRMQEEWYSPLLVPGRHYIPVRFEQHENIAYLAGGTGLINGINFAEHPDDVAKIVRHTKSFL